MSLFQFEQLKKQKSKGQKAGAAKKKNDGEETKGVEAVASQDTSEQADNDAEKPKSGQDGPEQQTTQAAQPEEQAQDQPETLAKPQHNRQPSLSLQSRMRSDSFRRTSTSQGPISPNGAKSPELPVLTPDGDSVNSIYRKQSARLDDLEKENKRLQKELQEAERRWRRSEEDLEDLRESSGEIAELKSKAQKAEAQAEEYNKIVCLYLYGHDPGGRLIIHSEARKCISAKTEFPATIPKQAPCLFSEPGQRIS